MYKLFVLVCFVFIVSNGCKNKSAKVKKGPVNYIDVTSYIKGQLAYLDTVPFAFLKTTLKDSVYGDSVFITKQQLNEIAGKFLIPELEKSKFEELYNETSFMDASINTITLTYQPEDAALPVQRVDVYANPENGEIKKIYIIRNEVKGDSVIHQQLLWKHNKSCTLITTKRKGDAPEINISEKINWNDTEE
ncbi:MAG: hypothetical protein K2X48_15450 [Chitinophagaceae bacterium]|nr:hypothetical protein [Chitinophagaceae bacterium]